MKTLREAYPDIIEQLTESSIYSQHFNLNEVFQEANLANRVILEKILDELIQPHSKILNIDALVKLNQLASEGKQCLILMEHFSNFDIPALFYLLRNISELQSCTDRISCIAAQKLNHLDKKALAFAEAYSRIIIYPSRELGRIEEPHIWAQEKKKSRELNREALHQMVIRKHHGDIILMFPSGMRYRPGDDSTRRGLPEVASYLKGFDYFVPIGIAGNILKLNDPNDFLSDYPVSDVMVYALGEVQEAKTFRRQCMQLCDDKYNKELVKQSIADEVMKSLQILHDFAVIERNKYVLRIV